MGAGVCFAFDYPAQFSVSATSITFMEGTDGDAGFIDAPFNGLKYSGLDFGPGFFLGGFGLTIASGLDFSAAPFFVTLDLYVGTVPEPATLLLRGTGLAGLGFLRRRAK